MRDDTVRVEDAFTVVAGVLSQAARGTVALENPSSSPTSAATATARCRTDRYAEAIQQAAQLASWEDEGGTTSS